MNMNMNTLMYDFFRTQANDVGQIPDIVFTGEYHMKNMPDLAQWRTTFCDQICRRAGADDPSGRNDNSNFFASVGGASSSSGQHHPFPHHNLNGNDPSGYMSQESQDHHQQIDLMAEVNFQTGTHPPTYFSSFIFSSPMPWHLFLFNTMTSFPV